MVNSPLIRPYFLGGGGIGGVPLDSHEFSSAKKTSQHPDVRRPPHGFRIRLKSPDTLDAQSCKEARKDDFTLNLSGCFQK